MFSPDDFTDANTIQMLNVIIMVKLQKPPLTNFHKMKNVRENNQSMHRIIIRCRFGAQV